MRNPLAVVYDKTIRRHLPRKYRVIAGVAVKDLRLFDRTQEDPEYKAGLVSAIHDTVNAGDRVEIVGFGMGVSTVHALDAGADEVTAYEAAAEMIDVGQHTLWVNRAAESSVNIQHAVVGKPVNVWGDRIAAKQVEPAALSLADVLVLDCEGAERHILPDLGTLPPVILCETHPGQGAPTDAVVSTLDSRYEVSLREYEPNSRDDKDVIVARYTPD